MQHRESRTREHFGPKTDHILGPYNTLGLGFNISWPGMELDTLDLSLFINGSEKQRADFANTLLSSFSKCGFVKLINHGFSSDMVETLFCLVKDLISN